MSYFNCTPHMLSKLREVLEHKLSYYIFDSEKLVNVSDKEDVIPMKFNPEFIPNDEYGKCLYFNKKLTGVDKQHRSFIRKLGWSEVQNLSVTERDKLQSTNVYEEIMFVGNSFLVVYFTF